MGLVRTNKIILLVGPTATGKTKVSIELAHMYGAVIINADSTQVYKEPLIATAKIKESEKEGIEHYLFDIVSLDDDYTLYDYQKDGRKLLDTLNKEKRNVIIVGGSGLYVKALLYNYKLEETKIYEIINVEKIETAFGKRYVLTDKENNKYWPNKSVEKFIHDHKDIKKIQK